MRSTLELIGGRWALLAALIAVSVPAAFLALMLGPWSPWALDRADALLRRGEPQEALQAYIQVSRWSLSEADEADALYRGGVLAAAEAERPQVAARMLRRFADRHPEHPHHVDALARMGQVVGAQLEDPLRGARLLRQAAEQDPSHPEAVDWLLRAAAFAESADSTGLAWVMLEQTAKTYPGRAADAWLAMARMRLSAGDAHGAEELYRQVLEVDASEAAQQLARLGLSISLEDQGDAEGAAAVAELEPGEDSAALELRRERLLERNEARGR
ncbi:MAG: tetratricopeptide repeat protein [Alphaproteobacteria bacterium]|nr:tetratricopeptide repeat protein [Alphaproteobacteria bacterium]MCB9796078.1 tetratricopeptide repeat protein [Alphaproteobacteria bacterium]